MRKRCWIRVCLLALAATAPAPPSDSFAQSVRTEGKRKIVVEVRPVYPSLAMKLNLSGTVRLRVTVSSADDAVRTEELGGSPLLVKAASTAISKAKWEPAALESKEILEIKFQLSQE